MSSDEISMPVWHEKHLRAATRAAGVALWSWNVDTDAITMDERAYDLWEVSKDEQNITFEILSQNIHPADLERVRSAFAATRAVIGAYEIDFRILSKNDIRWISARGQGDDADIADRIMFGIFLDVTQRKQAEEANELLAGEMSHRVKNLLQIATALTQITSRSAATKEDMARDLTNRLMALGRAQDLVRPVPGRTNEATLLGDLVSVLLAPYDEKGASVRIRVSVPKISVGHRRVRRWPSLSMNWQRTRQNTAPCRPRVAHWMCHAMLTTMKSQWCGPNGAVRLSWLRRCSKVSVASW